VGGDRQRASGGEEQEGAGVPAAGGRGRRTRRRQDVRPPAEEPPSGLVKGGQILKPGKFVRSPNEKYGLVQQTDGNLVLYQGKKALWSTATGRHPGAASIMQTDGNLVVYSKDKKVLWASRK
jgi:hypothetical protein